MSQGGSSSSQSGHRLHDQGPELRHTGATPHSYFGDAIKEMSPSPARTPSPEPSREDFEKQPLRRATTLYNYPHLDHVTTDAPLSPLSMNPQASNDQYPPSTRTPSQSPASPHPSGSTQSSHRGQNTSSNNPSSHVGDPIDWKNGGDKKLISLASEMKSWPFIVSQFGGSTAVHDRWRALRGQHQKIEEDRVEAGLSLP